MSAEKAAALDEAFAALRGSEPEELSAEEAEAKGQEVEAAWQAIAAAGRAGVARLKRELESAAEEGNEPFFVLNAAALLWRLRGPQEARSIARAWGQAPLHAHYRYVFFPAVQAAMTRDPRVMPMLVAILRDAEGALTLGPGGVPIVWPLTHEFVLGAFGPRGLPVLAERLRDSRSPPACRSAALLLSKAQYLEALPTVREIARDVADAANGAAVHALGRYGHPRDFDLLVEGLDANSPERAADHAYALYEYEDLRAVPHLLPLLDAQSARLRREAASALLRLLTPEGIRALHARGGAAPAEEGQWLRQSVEEVMAQLGTTWDEYAALSAEQQARLLAEHRRAAEGVPEELTMSRGAFLILVKDWTEQRRIERRTDGRQVLGVARTEDIPLLLEAQAAIYTRLSGECLLEIRFLDEIIKRLGRRRYREETGLTDHAGRPAR